MENYKDKEILFAKHQRGGCWLFMYREGTMYKTSHYCSVLYCAENSSIKETEHDCYIGSFVMKDEELNELRIATSEEVAWFTKFLIGKGIISINYARH